MDCLFCKIVSKVTPADIVFENESCLAFRDINPQAPVHILIVPKVHVEGIQSATMEHDLQGLLLRAAEIARSEGIDKSGYRLVINAGQGAGQSVFHLHVHLLGGRPMAWPPG